MIPETKRTVSIETHKRNIRSRIALLILRGISRLLTTEETRELKELQIKLAELQRQS